MQLSRVRREAIGEVVIFHGTHYTYGGETFYTRNVLAEDHLVGIAEACSAGDCAVAPSWRPRRPAGRRVTL